MSYIVMCQVSGGVTGFRQAPLKKGGEVRTFTTFAEAEKEAAALMALPRPFAKATFKYWAEEVKAR